MTDIIFHGGVKDIGGNKFLVDDKGTKIFMDFGMSFSKEKKFFAQFLNARTSNALGDMFELGILPKIKGLYRRDYAKHIGFGGDEDTDFAGVLLTHAHVDHCGYLKYLRPDIPVYCSEESRLIMQNFDDTGNDDEYLTHKEKFKVYKNRDGNMSRVQGDKAAVPRDVRVFERGKKFSIDSIDVEPMPVDHSISGVNAFILHTSSGSLANTADLRFHGRRSDDTEKFVERCAESSLDLLLCEGTRIDKNQSVTELDVETGVTKIVNDTKELVVCSYPIRDLDRFQSFYLAAKATGRYLVIDLKQAYLLNLFNASSTVKDLYPSSTDPQIKIYMPKGGWGLIDKDMSYFSERQLLMDYDNWKREFLDYDNMVDFRDIAKRQSDFIFYCSDFNLQQLIDVKPAEGSSYIRSSTEPFSEEMELDIERIKNWYRHFGLISSEKEWHQIHVSGHGSGDQIKRVIEGSNAKVLIPIHTSTSKDDSGRIIDNEDYHRKWHPNVHSVNQHDKYGM